MYRCAQVADNVGDEEVNHLVPQKTSQDAVKNNLQLGTAELSEDLKEGKIAKQPSRLVLDAVSLLMEDGGKRSNKPLSKAGPATIDTSCGSQVGRLITHQTVRGVLKIAWVSAEALYASWCRSWGYGNEMDRALAILRDAAKVADTIALESPNLTTTFLLCEGTWLLERLFRKGKRVDADRAVLVYQEVLIRDPNNRTAMMKLCYVRHYQYEATGLRWMLDEAVELINEVLVACPHSHPDNIQTVIFATLCLKDRAELDGCMDDLDITIELLRFGLNAEPSVGDGSTILNLLLAESLALRYSINEQTGDLQEAEDILKMSEQQTVQDQHDVYRNLVKGKVLDIRYKKFRNKKDIVASAKAYIEAYTGIGKNSARPQPVKILTSMKLAKVFKEAYYRQYSSLMLSSAHSFARSVWDTAIARSQDWQSDETMIEVYSTLGEIQRSRYQSRFKSGQTPGIYRFADRQEAIYWIGQLLRSRHSFQPDEMQVCLMEIGDSLQDFHKGPPTAELRDRAISHYVLAANNKITDLSTCIDVWRRMAQALIDKGDHKKNVKFYISAETYLDKIEAVSAQRNFLSAGHLPLMARLYEAKFRVQETVNDGSRAIEIYYKIFHNSNYGSQAKIEAALHYLVVITVLKLKKDAKSQELLQILEESQSISNKIDDARTYVIELVVQRVSDGSSRSQQLQRIQQDARIPLVLTWYSKYLKKSAFDILRLYERGRSVLWDRLINSRAQIDMLEAKHKDLAIRYRELRQSLANPMQPALGFTTLLQDRYHTAADLNKVIREIQGKVGFEDFLQLPLAQEDMQAFANRGSIIFLICGNGRTAGFALTVSSDSIKAIDLPSFTEERCKQQYELLQQVFATRNDAPDKLDLLLDEALKWLWYSAAKPVLQALGLLRTGNNKGSLPRVWWVTSTWTSRLPIHAAGDHKLAREQGTPCSVIDNVVSSYTPTLRALKYSRNRLAHLLQEPATTSQAIGGKALLVAMQDTPNRPRLKHAASEIIIIRAILEHSFESTLLLGPKVTRKDVIQNLRNCTVAHLACHGEADPTDPLRSKLLLQDYGRKALRVEFLMRMEMTKCQLAFLSACDTAVNRDESLLEEGLHLAGAFQMAGVPNTIATSWEVLDKEAVDVSVGFYRKLVGDDGVFNVRECARTLHSTVLEMRDLGAGSYVWGSYAHFGA